MSHLPLKDCVFCANCECVSDSKGHNCQACGSPSLVNLARMLEGSAVEAYNQRDLTVYSNGVRDGIESGVRLGRKEILNELLQLAPELGEETGVRAESTSPEVKSLLVN